MFGFMGIALGLASVFGIGWSAHDVAQNGLDVPGVHIAPVIK